MSTREAIASSIGKWERIEKAVEKGELAIVKELFGE